VTCKPFINDDGTRGIMCRRGFVEKPSQKPQPEGIPSPDLRPDFPVGQRVRHITFGPGVIVSKRPSGLGDVAAIDFDSVGRKELVLHFAAKNIKPLDAP
jgi:hypothetical protein